MEFWDRFPSESEGMVSLSSTIWYCWWEVLTSSWISFLHGSPVHLNPSPSHKTFIFSSWPLTSEIPLWCVLMFPPPGCFHFSSSFPALLHYLLWAQSCSEVLFGRLAASWLLVPWALSTPATPSALFDLSVFFHPLFIFPEIYCYISFPVFTLPWDYSFYFQVNIITFKRLQDAFSNQGFLMK